MGEATTFVRGTLYIDRHDNIYIVNLAEDECIWYGKVKGEKADWIRNKVMHTYRQATNTHFKIQLMKHPIAIYGHQDILGRHSKIKQPTT